MAFGEQYHKELQTGRRQTTGSGSLRAGDGKPLLIPYG